MASVIHVDRVSKCFRLRPNRPRSFQELFVKRFRPRHSEPLTDDRLLWALQDVSFSVEQGEAVGIIGSNGSGKTTCLRVLARILQPTKGHVRVQGRVSALLELGTGFHPELTGRENVYLYGSILGLTRREIDRRFDEIVSFAEIERFIDVPVKLYSSGMYVRLGFATAIHVDANILLLDEVLAVGDQSFQKKCLERIQQLADSGVTIVYVSHDLESVRNLCPRALWFKRSRLCEDGPSDQVISSYLSDVEQEGAIAEYGYQNAGCF